MSRWRRASRVAAARYRKKTETNRHNRRTEREGEEEEAVESGGDDEQRENEPGVSHGPAAYPQRQTRRSRGRL